VRWILPYFYWPPKTKEPSVYLTFDDGPIPEVTPLVLDILDAFGAKATFFCIGDNVRKYPDIYRLVLDRGHRVGNHTEHHLNGRKNSDEVYFENVRLASERIESDLFRPPYWMMRLSQMRYLSKRYKIVLGQIVTGDYDIQRSPEECIRTVSMHVTSGDIIVFHDSLKAWKNLSVALPAVLEYLKNKHYTFKTL
jgi:peptidoglycan/xylan/chitin deacetylase (PgdA/CDA1 family)